MFLFDEFQTLAGTSPYRKWLLEAIKALMDHRVGYTDSVFQAFLGFGTYSTVFLTQDSPWRDTGIHFSPIPLENTVYIRPLPACEIKSLFSEWSQSSKKTITDGVLDLIVYVTGGYFIVVSLT